MYGLKKDIDLTFLIRREIIQVAIGMYQVLFNFDEDTSIAVEGRFEYTTNASTVEWRPGNPLAACSAVKLLSARIEAVEPLQNGTLRLTFSNGDCLAIYDVSAEYESYQISRMGETIVV